MGSPVSGGEEFGGEEDFGGGEVEDFGGGEASSEKPFDEEPFDAGVEASEDDSPEKYIQQISGKLGQSLRKYTDEMGQPDFDLEKFAINSVLSATNSGKMDSGDQSDIIQKVKSSSTDGSGGNGVDHNDGANDGADDGAEDLDTSDEGGLDLSNIDMEESVNPSGCFPQPIVDRQIENIKKESVITKEPVSKEFVGKKVSVDFRKEIGIVKDYDDKEVVIHFPDLGFTEKINYKMVEVLFQEDGQVDEAFNPNPNGKTVFQDAALGVKEDGMEENKYLNLESTKKSSIIATKLRNMLQEKEIITIGGQVYDPKTKPQVQPQVKPERKTRRGKPYRIIPEQLPDPKPKAEKKNDSVSFIKDSGFARDGNSVTIKFDINGERFVSNFVNTGELLVKPEAYDESWVYAFESEVLSNGKSYSVAVAFFGHPDTNLEVEEYADGSVPDIEEV